jgi:CBS domain-containing protein
MEAHEPSAGFRGLRDTARRTITPVDSQRRDPTHMSSAPSALNDITDFLRAHPPFDALDPADVERAVSCVEVEFFLAGSVIFAQAAQPVEHLRVVRTGAVEIVLEGRVLGLLAPGELFGHASMLSRLPPGFAARAHEDTLCYRISQEIAGAALGLR